MFTDVGYLSLCVVCWVLFVVCCSLNVNVVWCVLLVVACCCVLLFVD